MQNTWLKVIRNMDKVREIPRERLPFWLICIAKNEAISILRQQKECVSLNEWAEEYPAAEDENLQISSVQELISSMPEIYRTILEMKFVEGFTNREIAQALKLSESAVGMRVLRGREMLKKRLEEMGVKE